MNLRNLLPLAALAPALFFSFTARADVPNEPPSVTITSPVDGATFDGPTATFDVLVDAFPGDEGIESVVLNIDGVTVTSNTVEPYDFIAVEVGEGMHTLTAVAVSAQTQVEHPSADVSIVVFADGGTGDTGGTDTGGTGGTGGTDTNGGTSGTGEGGEGSEDGAKGCAAVPGGRLGGGGAMILLGLFTLGLSRRRREI